MDHGFRSRPKARGSEGHPHALELHRHGLVSLLQDDGQGGLFEGRLDGIRHRTCRHGHTRLPPRPEGRATRRHERAQRSASGEI